MVYEGIEESDVHLHYLKILQKDSSIMQPEIRDAIDYAIKILGETKEE